MERIISGRCVLQHGSPIAKPSCYSCRQTDYLCEHYTESKYIENWRQKRGQRGREGGGQIEKGRVINQLTVNTFTVAFMIFEKCKENIHINVVVSLLHCTGAKGGHSMVGYQLSTLQWKAKCFGERCCYTEKHATCMTLQIKNL